MLDRTFGGCANRKPKSENPAGWTERQITVEQRFGITAQEILVAGLTDAKIKRVEATIATAADQFED